MEQRIHPIIRSQTKEFFCFLEYPTNIADPEDTDGDGLSNTAELTTFLNGVGLPTYNPTIPDTDTNGTTDGAEDFDGDGFTNEEEEAAGTDPEDISNFPSTTCPTISPESDVLKWNYIPIDMKDLITSSTSADRFSSFRLGEHQFMDSKGSVLTVLHKNNNPTAREFYLWVDGKVLELPSTNARYKLNRNGFLLFQNGGSFYNWRIYNIYDTTFQDDLTNNPGAVPTNAPSTFIKGYDSTGSLNIALNSQANAYLQATLPGFILTNASQVLHEVDIHDDNTVSGCINISLTAVPPFSPISTTDSYYSIVTYDFEDPANANVFGVDDFIATEDPYNQGIWQNSNYVLNQFETRGLGGRKFFYSYNDNSSGIKYGKLTDNGVEVLTWDYTSYDPPFDDLSAGNTFSTHSVPDTVTNPGEVSVPLVFDFNSAEIYRESCLDSTMELEDFTDGNIGVGSANFLDPNTNSLIKKAAVWSPALAINPSDPNAPTPTWASFDLNNFVNIPAGSDLTYFHNTIAVEATGTDKPPLILAQAKSTSN